jgi:hypothetical protein
MSTATATPTRIYTEKLRRTLVAKNVAAHNPRGSP